MTRRARLLIHLAVLFGASPALAAETAGARPGWLGLMDPYVLLVIGLAITVAAITAALISLRRLRRAFDLQRDIFGAVPQPRQVVGRNGRTVVANTAFYDFSRGVDRPTPDLLVEQVGGDDEARDQIARLAANARNGRAGYAELRVRPRAAGGSPGGEDDGQAEWRYVAAYPVSGRPGTVLWMVDDITLRHQMEQVIHEEQERFVDLLEHAPIGFYSVDGSGRFLFANRTLCDWIGFSHDDLASGAVRLHDVIADPLPTGTAAHDPWGSATDTHGEIALKSADGSRFQASISQDLVKDESGRVLRTRSVVRHLSRERAMAEALERSVKRFERFFLDAPVGIALLDPDGVINECNRAFATLLGKPADRLAGMSLFNLVHEAGRPAIRTALAQNAEAGRGEGARATVQARLVGASEKFCAVYITSISDTSGAVTGHIAHFIDTTEQKNLEMQFSQSQKMQAVGQLAGGIAHDFNNLLTAMIGFSDLLLLRHRPGDQSFADIMQIKQNANRAANLVRQLLAFSRQQTLQPRLLSVTDILAELSHLLRRLIGENIELEMIHGRDLGTVKADQGQLEQVIINLAVNARDAMAEGGTLKIRTSNVTVQREKKHKAEVMPPGDYVLLEVEDSGCGIPRENLDRIFDPFFSTKEVGAGTGLGLSTVYGIVKQTGGFVFVESDPAKGAVFSIYLPHHAEAAAAVATEEADVKAARDLTGAGTILLVEDEDAVRAFSARVLRSKGYDVLEARSGESALEVLNNRTEPIDLLITDVVMPRVDGPTLVRQVRKDRPDLNVIFISGYTEDAFRKRLGEETGIHFLPKPFSLKQLAGKVKEVMGEKDASVPGPAGKRRTSGSATGAGTASSA